MGDERLVERLREGDEVAFEVLFERHHAALLSFCRYLLGSTEQAEEAVQETFLAAHRQLRGPGRQVNHVKPWLFTVARNRCVSSLRGCARREVPVDDLPERASPVGLSEKVSGREDVRELLEDLRALPVDQRSALILAEIEALPHDQVARALGCETGQVKSLVFQARSQLLARRRERETSCAEFRKQIALGGAALRRAPVRRHLEACPRCDRYREELRPVRALAARALPAAA